MIRWLLAVLLVAAAGPILAQATAPAPDNCDRFIRGKSFILNPAQLDAMTEAEIVATNACLQVWQQSVPAAPMAERVPAADAPADPVGGALAGCAPADFDAAVACLRRHLPADSRAELAQGDGSGAHFGLGMYLRNGWRLWDPQSTLARSLVAEGFMHPDDMSAAILAAVAAAERGEPFDRTAAIAEYRAFWDSSEERAVRTGLPVRECATPNVPENAIRSCWRERDGRIVGEVELNQR